MLVLPVTIEKISSRKDRTWTIYVGTQELTPEQAAEIVKLNAQLCYMALKIEPFNQKETDILKDLQAELDFTAKSPAQRLRNTLYRIWEGKKEGYNDFNNYYIYKMDILIEHYKSKIL